MHESIWHRNCNLPGSMQACAAPQDTVSDPSCLRKIRAETAVPKDPVSVPNQPRPSTSLFKELRWSSSFTWELSTNSFHCLQTACSVTEA